MRLYLIAGEASGDLHGANLIRALQAQRPGISCRAWGGDLMQGAGADLVKHYRELAFMGFVEVLKNLRTILRNIAFCKSDILAFQPDALVLIDYPGFNLRIARWAKSRGIPVVYYISPQLWAWHASRAHAIRRDVDKLLVILPFEQEFFRKYGIEAEFVGHPLLDEIEGLGNQDIEQLRYWDIDVANKYPNIPISQYPNISISPNIPIIALLPGSRKQEIGRILPVMLESTLDFPQCQFIVAGASSLRPDFYQPFLEGFPKVKLVQGQTYALLRQSTAALVKSGTSTLETALLNVPQVVCYAGNWISYQIAKRLVNVQYISLVNLILDRPLVKELIQDELIRTNLSAALADILTAGKSSEIKEGYAELRNRLGGGGASQRAASAIIGVLGGRG